MNFYIYEKLLRLAVFSAVLACLAAWEWRFERKKTVDSKVDRWLNNLGLGAMGAAMLQSGVFLLPVSFAYAARARGIGVFNQFYGLVWEKWAAAILLLDLTLYLQHVLFHFVPVLWRLHQVHHSDLDVDVTTAIRFHPLEMVVSLLVRLSAVVAFGFPPEAVLTFEILQNAAVMFSHANIFIPAEVDRLIRLFLVTPDMHRVHHSVVMKESSTNFGFSLSAWDRLCGTYKSRPDAGLDGMTIGLAFVRKRKSFVDLLVMPFLKQDGR